MRERQSFDMGVHATNSSRGPEHDPITARWRKLIRDANEARAGGDVARARMSYEDALAEAEQIFATAMLAPTVEACVGPLLYSIATQNLAELARRCGDGRSRPSSSSRASSASSPAWNRSALRLPYASAARAT